jgi:hypothetical protein
VEKPEKQKTIRHTDRRRRPGTTIFSTQNSSVHPVTQASNSTERAVGQTTFLFFVSELLFSFVAVFFEQGFGPATLIVTQGKTNTE